MTLDPDRSSALHKHLKALPGLSAPEGLHARIMAAAAARQAMPWYKRAWWTWPVTARLAYGALLSVPFIMVLGAVLSGPGLPSWGLHAAGWLRPLETAVRALAVALGTIKVPLLCAAFFSYLSMVAAGSALLRLRSAHHAGHSGETPARQAALPSAAAGAFVPQSGTVPSYQRWDGDGGEGRNRRLS